MSVERFTSGNFAPVHKEIDATNLSVIEGEVPKDIDGMFVRNGSNPMFYDKKHYHWFEGDGMLHGVRIQNGNVSYKNRYVQTDDHKYEERVGKQYFLSFTTLKTALGFGYFMASKAYLALFGGRDPYSKDTANTALIYHDRRMMALMEGSQPHWVTAQTLDTIKKYDYDGELKHNFTAHPKVDRKTGEMIFFGYSLAKKPYVQYRTVSSDGKLSEKPLDLDIQIPVMMHDMAITENYSIIMDLPLEFRPSDKKFFVFNEERKSRFAILPRHAKSLDEVMWFEADTCYVFHVANAWEEGDKILLYGVRHDNIDMSGKLKSETKVAKNYLWTFDLKTKKVTEGPVDYANDGSTYEFPVINTEYMGYKSRYLYSMWKAASPKIDNFQGVAKIDVEKKTCSTLYHGDGRFGGEFSFVPKDGAKDEDDGYLIGFVYDSAKNNSESVIYDAKDLSLVSRVALPQRVPFGFHGMWLTKDQLNQQRSA
mmetsp:Transcript_6470/g.7026  ORF Transcript_6470/g.7026 Transcript_6470/m.7026 type:complete len:480 (+) Transcript_6470:73-1512(+)